METKFVILMAHMALFLLIESATVLKRERYVVDNKQLLSSPLYCQALCSERQQTLRMLSYLHLHCSPTGTKCVLSHLYFACEEREEWRCEGVDWGRIKGSLVACVGPRRVRGVSGANATLLPVTLCIFRCPTYRSKLLAK